MSPLFEPIAIPGDKAQPKTNGVQSPVFQVLSKKYEEQNAIPDTPDQVLEKNPLDLKARLQKIGSEAKNSFAEADKRQADGTQRGGSTGLQKLGAGVKAVAETVTIPLSMAVDTAGKAITAGREKQKQMDDEAIANGTLNEADALSRKPHLEDQIAELVGKGLNSEQGQKLRDYYNGLSPEAKGNVKGVTDLLSGAFDLATLGIGKKVVEGGAKKVAEKVAKNTAEKEAKILADKALEATGKKVTDKGTARALENITPKPEELTPTEYEDLVAKGRINPKTLKSPASYIPSEEEIKTASKYKDALQSKEPIENIASIKKIITDKDAEVGTFLKKNNGIYNNGELRNYLTEKLKPISDLTVDEARLEKLKTSTIDNFINGLPKNDMETLWKSRKEFDQTIEKAFSGSPTLQKEIKVEFRNGIQDFIADRTPDTVYKDSMKEMSNLYRLRDTVLTKASKEKNVEGRIEKWIKDNPKKAKALGLAGTALAGKTAYDFLAN